MNASDTTDQQNKLKEITTLKQRIYMLEKQRNACAQFNQKVALNIELQKLKKQLTTFR
ncbi:DUF4391 domain-containing protein [Candidatus Nitrosacidococcus sp. I8]|uniref:DUF4391 domain-containing protein n=1 Tax=Candidatus Nitrosacidococcus sp. I8 TaxID=2942908 RepID=UPI0039B6FD20